MKKGQRQVTIALMRNEIEYDAQSILSVIADTLPSAETAHVKHIYNDICEGENARRPIRFADTRWQCGWMTTPRHHKWHSSRLSPMTTWCWLLCVDGLLS